VHLIPATTYAHVAQWTLAQEPTSLCDVKVIRVIMYKLNTTNPKRVNKNPTEVPLIKSTK